MASADDDDLPRMLGGRYRLEATIGHGGMGVVYRGIDLTMQRPIAVKLIRSVDGNDIDDEIAGRFLREAKHTARLQHEHIIDVFDLGRDASGMYFVMELLQGESLSAKLRRDGKLTPAKAVHIGVQICEALEVAHRGGIIHRDLKPANIMLVSRAGDDEFVKVLDFGVAKSVTGDEMTQLTHTGMLVGTVDYMAPEQIMGKPVDGRTDVYSLGVMLYKMLCGKAPFRDGGVPALIHAHLNTMPKPLIEMAEGIPNELDHVILRCLMKKPERRYDSMAELARALAHTMAPEEPRAMVDLEYRGANDSYADDNIATRLNEGFSDDDPPPEDATISDDPTVQFDRMKPQRRLTAEELGLPPASRLRAHEGNQPLPAPPKPRPLIPLNPSAGPAFGPPVNYPEELSTQKRHVPQEVKRMDVPRTEGKVCAMCQTKNPMHALACVACGVSLGTSEQEALRARNRSAPPKPSEIPNIPSGLGLGAIGLPPIPVPPTPPSSRRNLSNTAPPGSVPPAPSSSRRDMAGQMRTGPHAPVGMEPRPLNMTGPHQPVPLNMTGPHQPPTFPPGSIPPPSMPPPSYEQQYPGAPPGWPYQQSPHSQPPPPASTWERFLKWTGLK
jgi:serine/threonine-protein kinase